MLIERATNLQVLSLRYCQHISEDTLEMISQKANPFFLRELYLDGCEKINDSALLRLTKTRSSVYPNSNLNNLLNNSVSFWKELKLIAGSEAELRRLVSDMSMSGSRGLEVISLAECRHITDEGVVRLSKCKLLRKVCFLGCANLKDEGIIKLASELTYLEDLNVGSTNITGESLRKLVVVCLDLKKVNITGCKRLNASDDIVLKQNGINVDAGEDVFRFHLIPEYNSDLPKITSSVLKTRSTLSLHKVYKSLIKKLEENNAEDLFPDFHNP